MICNAWRARAISPLPASDEMLRDRIGAVFADDIRFFFGSRAEEKREEFERLIGKYWMKEMEENKNTKDNINRFYILLIEPYAEEGGCQWQQSGKNLVENPFLENASENHMMEKLSYGASILGMTVIGAMIATMVSLQTTLSFTLSGAETTLQSIFDQIFLPCCASPIPMPAAITRNVPQKKESPIPESGPISPTL